MKRATSLTKQSSNSKVSTQTSFKNQKYQHIKPKYKEPKKIIGATSFDLTNSSGKLSVLPQSTIRLILQLSVTNYQDLIYIKQVCLRFYYELDTNVKMYQFINPLSLSNIKEIVNHLKIVYFNSQISKYTEFHEKMNSLFQYGATKLNLPDKLLESLQLSAFASINKKSFTPTLLFRKLNFASHLYFKIILDGIPLNMKNDTYDSIKIHIKIESKYLSLSKEYSIEYDCQEILKRSNQQKAFSYMTDGHYLFTYFQNDKQLLYMLWENSTVELMYYFWQNLKRKYFWKNKTDIQKKCQAFQKQQAQIKSNSRALSESRTKQKDQSDSDDEFIPFQIQKVNALQLPAINKPNQQQQQQLPPKPKQKQKVSTFLKTKMITEKIIYKTMKDYMQDQQDFELMINIHTGIKGQNLFYFIDTKAMPRLDQDYLYFTYKMKEHINLQMKLYLDNKLGMKEVVENLYLCDITFKDRDDFRILFSGFVQMFEEDTTSVSKQYDVSYLDVKEWRSLKLFSENRFELVVLFATSPSVIKLLELKIININ